MSYYGTPGNLAIGVGTGQVPPVPFDQPKNLFRFGEQSLWSTQLHQAGAIANSSFRLFSTPIGQQGQGFTNALTIAETNLKEGGRVPAGVAYDVFGVACQVALSTNAADVGGTISQSIDTQATIQSLLNIITNGVLSWDFTQTQVDIAPVNLVGAGGGAYGAVATGNAVNAGQMNNGAGHVWLYRKHPVALPGSSTFSILLRYGSRAAAVANNSVFCRVVLLGYYKNVIEIG
tara:strand:+ start:729 stop:1424 length:696 start_codon:yes stop_codon:yes gene_type:complete